MTEDFWVDLGVAGVFRAGAGRAGAFGAGVGAGSADTLLDWSKMNGAFPGVMGADAAFLEDSGPMYFIEPMGLSLSLDFGKMYKAGG